MKSFLFGILIFTAILAGILLQPQRAVPAPPSKSNVQVVEITPPSVEVVSPPKKSDPVPAPPTPLPAEAPPPAHAEKMKPKVAAQPSADAGTVEREENPRLVRMNDGSLIVDKYWTIQGGDGSAESPLRLTWELLLSGQSDFDITAAHPELPDRLKWLNGKCVEVKGYTLKSVPTNVPLSEFTLNDQLMDNCPICTARSVFATISVKVKTPETLERGLINVFTIRGTFKAEPVKAAGFVLGIFSLQDGEIISRSH